ncbi:hypothetical protein [Actinokineospora globicatena]|uniref:Uncharacterized protein n=1 Tax=Actinokineospora globicatena TaxID=103729 RepID=A0A9W6QLI9_9PSEU|nr:hypothetical protein [Actinokineospora globicatena]GLW91812.1 hypothetical protein Aglo03_26280 [Actinokineospora globicatena]
MTTDKIAERFARETAAHVIHVAAMTEGEWIVRGTTDPHVALAAVIDSDDDYCEVDGLLAGVARPRPGIESDDYRIDPAAVQAMADWCHDKLRRARTGYYRKVNCLPGSEGEYEGWTWQLSFANGPGHGAFPGVYFTAW